MGSLHLFSPCPPFVSTGYFLAVGITSFAICYQHGPLTSELNITLFTWTLQLTASVLIYCGVTIPQVAYALIAVSLCSKSLCYPLGAACHIGRFVSICECASPCITRKYWRLIMENPLHLNSEKSFKAPRHRNSIIFHLAVLSMSFVLWRMEKCDCALKYKCSTF